MEESILTSIKKILGIPEDYEQFDMDVIMHINTVFSILRQMGVGSSSGFSISDKTSKWSDFIEDMSKLEMLKTYMGLKTRLLFDPPTSGSTTEAINKAIDELEFRISIEVDDRS